MKIKKENCIFCIDGIVISLQSKGLDFPTLLTVRYEVNSERFEITESIKLRSEKIKLGFLTIGQKKVAMLPDVAIGSTLRVQYNPSNPAEAFLPDNTGKVNV